MDLIPAHPDPGHSPGYDRYSQAVLCGRRDPNGKDIRLWVEGADWQLKTVSEKLKGLTALPQKTKDGTGEVTIPLTWAMVTQVSRVMRDFGYGWRPDPGLNQWIADEFLRRHDTEGDLKFDVKSLHRTPMPHQAAGAYVGALNKRFFFCDDMRPQPVDTPILTPMGWTELGKLVPGSKVYAQDGTVTAVTAVKFFGIQPVFRVTMSDRTSTRATADHRWRVFTANQRHRPETRLGQEGKFMTTAELLNAGLFEKNGRARTRKFFLPQQPVIDRGRVPRLYEVDPYAYGALLGDGHLAEGRASLCCPDEDIHERVTQAALNIGTTSRKPGPHERCLTTHFHRDGRLLPALRILGALELAAEKHVHPWYKLGDVETRRDLLRGLLDTDGTVTREHAIEFCSVSSQLAQDVAFLGRSLGGVVTESDPQPAYLNGERKQDKYRVYLRFPADGPNPFWCKRKASTWESAVTGQKRRNPPRSITAIEPDGETEVCCIRIAHPSHVYLTDTALIPTGNTGKTMTALLTMAELEARGEDPFPAFVVAPASVVDSWLEELDACFPDWPATAYRGPKRRLLSSRYRVYVMSWDSFRTDMKHDKDELPPLLEFLVPRTIVYDEAHCLCNTSTRQSVAARQAARVIPFAFLMSGTPITRDVGGFWSALNVLDIRSFPDPDRYKDSYTDRYKGDYSDQVDGLAPKTREEFYVLMQGSMRRIAKSDVNKDFPPRTYSTRVVNVPPAYRAAYDEMEADMIAHLPDGDEPLEVMSTLAQLQRLTQLASSACDVTVTMELDTKKDSLTFGEMIPRYHVTMREPSWKVDELMAVMDENQGTGNPLLVFSPHTQLVNLAGKRAEREGYRVGYITGQQSAARKKAYRIAYQAGELDLLCCNVTAGGVGLTLNRGDTVVFLERPWAYWQANQAESRADDVMAAKQVHVIDIVAANTVESRVRQALKDKARQLSELVRDPRIVEELLGGQPLDV